MEGRLYMMIMSINEGLAVSKKSHLV